MEQSVTALAKSYRSEINKIFNAMGFKCKVISKKDWNNSYTILVTITDAPANLIFRENVGLSDKAKRISSAIKKRITELIADKAEYVYSLEDKKWTYLLDDYGSRIQTDAHVMFSRELLMRT